MKTRAWLCLPLSVLLLGATEYARQWTVELASPDAGAYRLTLDEAIYRHAIDPALRDVDVIDAGGKPVPAMLFAADAPAAQPGMPIELPWFALPGREALPSDALSVISERADDGRVLKVEVRERDAASPTAPSNWLLDASHASDPLQAITLQFAPGPDFETDVHVEGSDDLQSWRALAGATRLIRLARDGRQVAQTRIALDGHARYLRVSAGHARLPVLQKVEAETRGMQAASRVQWQTWPPARISPDRTHFEFDVEGRFPFDQADVQMPGNAAGSWRLESRAAADAPWQRRAGPWTLFQLGAHERSAVQPLAEARRDRHWRLIADAPVAATPQLRLGWSPEVLVFVAAGTPPYRVVAGSARSRRADAPIDDLLAQMRARRGAGWQPAEARTHGPGEQASAAALTPAPPPRDWKHIALWTLLVLAALAVAGFAASLLRQKPSVDDGQGR